MLQVQSLRFRYPNAPRDALNEVSFIAPTGQIFGFLGPSGCGKSTVQKIMIKLLALQSGTVRFGDQPLESLGRAFFAKIGVSFEQPNLFARLSVRENLTCFAPLYAGRPMRDPDALLEQLDLGAARDTRAQDCSKGMKQRLVFARAILHQPDYLFLDEPTSGLDPVTVSQVVALIRQERARGATILLTTHDMRVVEQACDRLALLHQGQIVAHDSPRGLKLAHGERAVVVERREDDQVVTSRFALDDPSQREALGQALTAPGVETVHTQEASLESVFARLTGRRLS